MTKIQHIKTQNLSKEIREGQIRTMIDQDRSSEGDMSELIRLLGDQEGGQNRLLDLKKNFIFFRGLGGITK